MARISLALGLLLAVAAVQDKRPTDPLAAEQERNTSLAAELERLQGRRTANAARLEKALADTRVARQDLKDLVAAYETGADPSRDEVLIRIRRLERLVDPPIQEAAVADFEQEQRRDEARRDAVTAALVDLDPRFAKLREKDLAALADKSAAAAREAAWEAAQATRADLLRRINQALHGLLADAANLRAHVQQRFDAYHRQLFLLRRNNLLLRTPSPLESADLRRAPGDLARLPAWLAGSAASVGSYMADHTGALARWAGLWALAFVLVLLLVKSARVQARRAASGPLAQLWPGAVRTVRLVGVAALVFLAPWLAGTTLPGIAPGVAQWLRLLGWVAGGLWLGLGLCREIVRHNLPERPARVLALHLRVLLVLSAVLVPLHGALEHLGYENESVLEVVELMFATLLAVALASLLFRRGLLASLVPDPESGAGKVLRVALRALQPCLALLVPTTIVLRILNFDVLANMLFRYSLALLAGALGGWLGYRAGAVLIDVWSGRLFPPDVAPRRHQATRSGLRFLLGLAVWLVGITVFLFVSGDTAEDMQSFLDHPLPLQRGDATTATTYWDLVVAIVIIVLFLFGAKHAKAALHDILLRRTSMDPGLKFTVTTIVGYVLVAMGAYMAITRVFDLSSLGTVIAALSVGIGFGLQEIISNFVSGLILLFERPLKVGDFVSVGGQDGIVQSINIRSSTIKTNDNTYLMVPNKEFVAQTVVNYRHRDPKFRVHIPVGVSYHSDPEQVREVLLGVAGAHSGVLQIPRPDVWFTQFGDSSINFELLVWISEPSRRRQVHSEIVFAIFRALAEAGIEIPFPQRDLHLKTPDTLSVKTS